jgi:hypothetical protein
VIEDRERLATTPLSPYEWLLAHALVNVVLVGAAFALLTLWTVAGSSHTGSPPTPPRGTSTSGVCTAHGWP